MATASDDTDYLRKSLDLQTLIEQIPDIQELITIVKHAGSANYSESRDLQEKVVTTFAFALKQVTTIYKDLQEEQKSTKEVGTELKSKTNALSNIEENCKSLLQKMGTLDMSTLCTTGADCKSIIQKIDEFVKELPTAEKVAQQEMEIKRLRRELEELQPQLTSLRNESIRKDGEGQGIDRIKNELMKSMGDFCNMKREHSAQQQEIILLRANLHTVGQQKQAAEMELDRCSRQLEWTRQQAENTVEQLNTEIVQAGAQANCRSWEFKELEKKYDKLSSESQEKIKALESRQEESESSLAKLKVAYEEQRSQTDIFERRYMKENYKRIRLEGVNENLSLQIDELNAKYEATQDDLLQKMEKSGTDLEDSRQKVQFLQGEINGMKVNNGAVQDKLALLEELRASFAQKSQDIDEWKVQAEETYAKSLQGKQDRIKELSGKLSTYRHDYANLKEEKSGTDKMLEAKVEKIQELEENLKDARLQIDTANEINTALKAEKATLQHSYGDLEKQLAEAQNSLKEQRKSRRKLELETKAQESLRTQSTIRYNALRHQKELVEQHKLMTERRVQDLENTLYIRDRENINLLGRVNENSEIRNSLLRLETDFHAELKVNTEKQKTICSDVQRLCKYSEEFEVRHQDHIETTDNIKDNLNEYLESHLLEPSQEIEQELENPTPEKKEISTGANTNATTPDINNSDASLTGKRPRDPFYSPEKSTKRQSREVQYLWTTTSHGFLNDLARFIPVDDLVKSDYTGAFTLLTTILIQNIQNISRLADYLENQRPEDEWNCLNDLLQLKDVAAISRLKKKQFCSRCVREGIKKCILIRPKDGKIEFTLVARVVQNQC